MKKNSIVIIILLFFLSSCHLRNNSKNSSYSDATSNSCFSFRHFTSIKYKALLSFSSDSVSYKALCSVSINKDSAISLVVKLPIGIKIASIFITPDTLIASFSASKDIHSNNLYFFNVFSLPINFYSVQSILTDDFFVYPFFNKCRNYRFNSDSSAIFYFSKNKYTQKKLISHKFVLDSLRNIVSSSIKDLVNKQNLFIKYLDFKSFSDSIYFPSTISISDSVRKSKYFIIIKNLKYK